MLAVIANALRSPSARLIEEGCRPYQNSKEAWGYCLTVWDAGYYHMISVSHVHDMPTPESVAAALASPTRKITDEGLLSQSERHSGLLCYRKKRRALVHGFNLRHPAALPRRNAKKRWPFSLLSGGLSVRWFVRFSISLESRRAVIGNDIGMDPRWRSSQENERPEEVSRRSNQTNSLCTASLTAISTRDQSNDRGR